MCLCVVREEGVVSVSIDIDRSSSLSSSFARPPLQSIVSDNFQGFTRSCVACATCGTESETIESFFELSLGIPSGEEHIIDVLLMNPMRLRIEAAAVVIRHWIQLRNCYIWELSTSYLTTWFSRHEIPIKQSWLVVYMYWWLIGGDGKYSLLCASPKLTKDMLLLSLCPCVCVCVSLSRVFVCVSLSPVCVCLCVSFSLSLPAPRKATPVGVREVRFSPVSVEGKEEVVGDHWIKALMTKLRPKNQPVTVYDALYEFTEMERLGEDYKFPCPYVHTCHSVAYIHDITYQSPMYIWHIFISSCCL